MTLAIKNHAISKYEALNELGLEIWFQKRS